jgi:prepilin-type N-terminal cleavage/methylation domain-containing protein
MFKSRAAFTLIELIFAIVIIGIAAVSIPTISQITHSGVEQNLAQEAILLSSAEIVKTVSGKWDENSKPDGLDLEYIVFNDAAEAAAAAGTSSRPGNVRILYQPAGAIKAALGIDNPATEDPEAGTADDVDDYAGASNAVTAAGSRENFKDLYTKNILITNPASFGAYVANGNIKRVTVQIFKSDATLLTQLYIYVTNSGSAAPVSRTL